MTSCARVSADTTAACACAPPPLMGPQVAGELSTLDPAAFSAFGEWLGRWDKFIEQTEANRGEVPHG